jgi:acyl carrier protein
MPLTANGKIDRQRLQVPDSVHPVGRSLIAPRGKTEETIAEIWRRVLGTEEMGSNEPFFDVGGDSLKLLRVFRHLDELYPNRLSVVDLFKYNTVKELGDFIDGPAGTASSAGAVEAFEI